MKKPGLNSSFRPEMSRRESIGSHTRKSIVGALYRVGASFTLDAVYLTVAGAAAYYFAEHREALPSIISASSDFVSNLSLSKLGRVTAFVVGINFVDYKYHITDRLDLFSRNLGKCIFHNSDSLSDKTDSEYHI